MTDTPFEVRSSRVADTLIVEILGEIDMATAPELAGAIDSVQDGTRRVIVNLSEVGFLDSSGLSALVQCERTLTARDISFRIVSPADRAVRKVFEITQLTGPLNVVESLAEALA